MDRFYQKLYVKCPKCEHAGRVKSSGYRWVECDSCHGTGFKPEFVSSEDRDVREDTLKEVVLIVTKMADQAGESYEKLMDGGFDDEAQCELEASRSLSEVEKRINTLILRSEGCNV